MALKGGGWCDFGTLIAVMRPASAAASSFTFPLSDE